MNPEIKVALPKNLSHLVLKSLMDFSTSSEVGSSVGLSSWWSGVSVVVVVRVVVGVVSPWPRNARFKFPNLTGKRGFRVVNKELNVSIKLHH